MKKTVLVVLLLLVSLFAIASPALAGLYHFTVYWYSSDVLAIYWQGADMLKGGSVIVEYKDKNGGDWVQFEKYYLNFSNRLESVSKDDPRFEKGHTYLFRCIQVGVDNPEYVNSSGGSIYISENGEAPPDDATDTGSDGTNTDGDVSGNGGGTTTQATAPLVLFNQSNWEKIIFWYNILASLSGVFIFYVIIKCGYKYIFASFNPGTKASLTETLQRCVIAVAIIILTPAFIKLAVTINDAFVHMFAVAGNSIISAPTDSAATVTDSTGMFEKIVAAPFQVIINIFTKIFGLQDLSTLIFNGELTVFKSGFWTGQQVDTGNIFGNVIIQLAFVGFTVYYNALYTIRRWVIIATVTATPLIVGIWMVSEEKQVLEIWAGELISTIFMQLFHAFTFALFFSIASAKPISSIYDALWLATGLKDLGVWVASLGGAVAAGGIILLGFKLATADSEKERADVKSRLGKVLIGLVILGVSLTLASYLVNLLGGSWGLKTIQFDSGSSSMGAWELFFMLLVIIPTSKMMHNIFMKLIQRIGTVDEEKWASIGTGALGGLVGMAVMGKVASGALYGKALGKAGSALGATGKAMSGNALLNPRGGGPNGPGGPGGGGIAASGGGLGPVPGSFDHGRNRQTFGDTIERNLDPSASAPQNPMADNFYARTPEGPGFSGGGFDDAMDRGAASSSKWVKYGAGVGAASSFAIPPLVPAMAAVGGAIGKTIGAPIATAGSIIGTNTTYGMVRATGKGRVESLRLSGGFSSLAQELKTGARDMTGARSGLGAASQIATGVILSPLGSNVAKTGARAIGKGVDAIDGAVRWRR